MSQDEHQRVQRIKEYVLARLRGELAAAPRGAQARLAKKLGVSGAHLSNMLSPNPTRAPGEDFRRKVAAHWGMTYAQLEASALGEEPPRSVPAEVPPPNLLAAIGSYRWTVELPSELRRVVFEQARQHHAFFGEDQSEAEWQSILTGLEREALAHLARRERTATAPPPSTRSEIVPRHPHRRAR